MHDDTHDTFEPNDEYSEAEADTRQEEVSDLLRRVAALHEVRRYRDAAPLLARVLQLDPESYDAHCYLANTEVMLGDFREALRIADKAIALCPEDDWAFRIRTILLQSFGQHREAWEAAQMALRLDPEAHETLGLTVSASLNVGDWDMAHDCLARLRKLHPEMAKTEFLAGNLVRRLGDKHRAEICYRRALALDPHYEPALQALGEMLDGQDRKHEATELLYRAAAADPNTAATDNRLLNTVTRTSGDGAAFMLTFVTVVGIMTGASTHFGTGPAVVIGVAASVAAWTVLKWLLSLLIPKHIRPVIDQQRIAARRRFWAQFPKAARDVAAATPEQRPRMIRFLTMAAIIFLCALGGPVLLLTSEFIPFVQAGGNWSVLLIVAATIWGWVRLDRMGIT